MLTKEQAMDALRLYPELGKQCGLSPNEMRVYNILDEHKELTPVRVSFLLRIGHTDANNQLRRLERKGFIWHIKVGRTNVYRRYLYTSDKENAHV